MISRVRGTLLTNDLERVEIETTSGLVYEIEVPLTVLDRLPQVGQPVELRTLYVVREDSATLFGFAQSHEREMFKRLLGASGVGPKLALAMLSTFTARRLARAIADKDLTALTQISGVGKKTAERISLELADRVQDLAVGPEGEPSAGPKPAAAVQALVALGYTALEADRAIREAIDAGTAASDTDALIRIALAGRT